MDDILQFSKKLIAIPSTQDNPKAMDKVLGVCKQALDGFKFETFEKKGATSLLFYNTQKLPEKFKIILNAHLDVIPAKKTQYSPIEKNDRLYGRGANDMKAATATMILLFKELANSASYPLGLQLVTDEEIGGFNGTKYQIEKGVRADFVIAGEPTELGINNEAKGIIWLKLKTVGVSSHGAYPWNGDNAILKMKKVIDLLDEEFPVPQKESWKTTVNVAKIESSNQSFNKVPDDCTINLDVRYIPQDKNIIMEEIKKLLPKDVKIEIVVNEPMQYTKPSNPYILTLKKITKNLTGTSSLIVKHGSSDIRHFNQVGCDGITFGPIGANHHADEEWVSLKSLKDYYQIIKRFLTATT